MTGPFASDLPSTDQPTTARPATGAAQPHHERDRQAGLAAMTTARSATGATRPHHEPDRRASRAAMTTARSATGAARPHHERDRQAGLAAMTSPEVGGMHARRLVVPLGSLEQHGPHLPLATDTIIASYVARQLVEDRDDLALAPAIPLGASGEHAGFPGTLSIGTEALSVLLVELVRDATRDYESVVLLNGHGGNAAAIAAAQSICAAEGRRVTALQCHFPGGDAHAGRTETSVMLHIAAHLVRLERAAPGATAPVQELMAHLRDGGIAAVSANGVLGDPTGATAAEGERLLAELLARLQSALRT